MSEPIPPHWIDLTPALVKQHWLDIFQHNPKLAAKNALRLNELLSWNEFAERITNGEQMLERLDEVFKPKGEMLAALLPDGLKLPKDTVLEYDPQKDDVGKMAVALARRLKREGVEKKKAAKKTRQDNQNQKCFEKEAREQEQWI